MNKYLGVKLVEAEPMTLGAYNEFKGWTIPADEDPLKEGYKVVYSDDYISWSPKDVFDDSYKTIKVFEDIKFNDYIKDHYETLAPHQQRMVTEMVDLDKKIVGLDSFILENPIYPTLSENEQNLLVQQVRSMQYYFRILVERINDWTLD